MLYYIPYITESWQRFLKRNQISYGPHQEQIFDGLVDQRLFVRRRHSRLVAAVCNPLISNQTTLPLINHQILCSACK